MTVFPPLKSLFFPSSTSLLSFSLLENFVFHFNHLIPCLGHLFGLVTVHIACRDNPHREINKYMLSCWLHAYSLWFKFHQTGVHSTSCWWGTGRAMKLGVRAIQVCVCLCVCWGTLGIWKGVDRWWVLRCRLVRIKEHKKDKRQRRWQGGW